MKIQNLSFQNHKVKHFRINSTFLRADGIFSPSKYVRDYAEPEKAREWFIKGQRAKTIKERAFCFSQMGEYRLIDTEQEKFVDKKFSPWGIFKMQLKNKVKKIEGKINDLFR